MTNLIVEIIKEIEGCQFASLTYRTKATQELARYTVNLGFSYIKLLEKSITELEIMIRENESTWTPLQKQASANVMASLKKSLEAHRNGEQSDDYTKRDQYIPIGNGLSLNTTDNTIQLFGLLHSKVTLVKGVYKEVNSRPLTIAQNEIRKQLSISKFREFALDLNQISKVKVNGDTLELLELDPVSV